MHLNFLDFEQPIADLMAKIDELKQVGLTQRSETQEEIAALESKMAKLTESIFADLNTMQKVQLSRHPLRPYVLDYIPMLFTDFQELHGDRAISAGPSIVAGLARFDGQPVAVLGHQKGRRTEEKLRRNFGMPRPEDYRKALRIMKLAEKFSMPIITFVDTAGAYPGIGAEERNQSEAIARNLFEMTDLKTPILTIVTGEGGSGGALALSVSDRLFMLQYSTYSVITPEGCASILWKSAERSADAAKALGMTADKLDKMGGLIDGIIEEPLGGAHRHPKEMAERICSLLKVELEKLREMSTTDLLDQRYKRLMAYGVNH
ncbi:MAG: acetyl-CoA carboxylase carboxyl transferase subunit alpha [Gammaproteobacteria bacterium CG11_big_fil_rev_8_21_14_0_20_46_22]|nr:MAG: acetyl-CoA carboxylase carboxyl transferase subunit alpha [Gammaproteobacteria bacterium CG12_big_fil_rev_8_21_14_0_65_46_12]PIR10128.1 MAG: acetyl-CoA carboxylase carboxyl transferase subunit alpha [Gammaproteobacteria bacterium CG11_big_fil_rev_8_21_14_0_20_46_22]